MTTQNKLTNGDVSNSLICNSPARRVVEMGERSEYFNEWYTENRSDLLVTRRDKYKSDPEYAEQCRERARQYRARGGAATAESRPRRSHTVTIGGTQHEAWTVGFLAKGVGRSVATVNHWERNGLMPRTPLKTDAGDRLYTKAMIAVVASQVKKRRTVKRTDDAFRVAIDKGWKKLGL